MTVDNIPSDNNDKSGCSPVRNINIHTIPNETIINTNNKEQPYSNSNHHTHKKPISTTSPAAMAAANAVTPERLSKLLSDNGPLAIRYITKQLGTDIPHFKDLSSSKQRRLIMTAMETGDFKNNILFEKIGWGQWSIKVVDSKDFQNQRKLINLKNAEVKYINTNSRKNSINTSDTTPIANNDKSGTNKEIIKPNLKLGKKVLYIDENAIASDDDDDIEPHDNESDIEFEDGKRIIKTTIIRPRKRLNSFAAPDYNYNNTNIYNRNNSIGEDNFSLESRRHSTVVYNSSTNNNENNNSRLKSPTIPFLLNPIDDNISPLTPTTTQESRRNSLIVPTCKTKLSNIRSTLLPSMKDHNTNSNTITNNISSNTKMEFYNCAPSASSSPLQNQQQLPRLSELSIHSDNLSNNNLSPYSDTDEEDWASIGAASLRNTSAYSLPLPMPMTSIEMIKTNSNSLHYIHDNLSLIDDLTMTNPPIRIENDESNKINSNTSTTTSNNVIIQIPRDSTNRDIKNHNNTTGDAVAANKSNNDSQLAFLLMSLKS